MKAFILSLLTLILLVVGLGIYSGQLQGFSETLYDRLSALPSTAEECEEARASALHSCEELLNDFREKELFIHLAVPYERMESAHEKFIQLGEYLRTGAYTDFCATRALCLEEVELFLGFEKITLKNLV